MLTEMTNLDALKRTTDFLVGPDGTAVIAKTYHAINQAMQAAYQQGFEQGYKGAVSDAYAAAKIEAEADVEERLDDAFDNGFLHGQAQVEEDAGKNEYDEGYINGVADARARPAVADEVIQDIINEAADALYGQPNASPEGAEWVDGEGNWLPEFDPSLVTDSGDESL